MNNPFTFGNPINDPSKFIGRQQELEQIVSRLKSTAHESTSIIGERRIGKTSLLMQLANPLVLDKYGLDTNHYCPVYIDFQGLTSITPTRFWQRVISKINASLEDEELCSTLSQFTKMESLDLFDLEDLFDAFKKKDKHVLLFMDEFENITQNPNFGEDFFGGLRSLAIHSNLSLIPATRDELVDLCYSEAIKSSPFFNIFATIILRPFSTAEYCSLIDLYTQGTEVQFSEVEKQSMYQLSGGYPFFVQLLGFYYCKFKQQIPPPLSITDAVTAEFENQAEPHFDYMWNRSTESEKITLLTLLVLQVQPEKPETSPTIENLTELHPYAQQDVQNLLKRGLVIQEGNEYKIFSKSFAKWISKEISAAPDEAQEKISVDDWLKEQGNDLLKPTKKVFPLFKRKYWDSVGKVVKKLAIDVASAVAVEIVKGQFK